MPVDSPEKNDQHAAVPPQSRRWPALLNLMGRIVMVRHWRPRTSLNSAWLRMRFEQKLTGALVATLLFAVLMAMFANWTARHSHDLFERSRLASEVLDGYRRLASTKYELLQSLGQSIISEPGRQELETFKIDETIYIRQLEDLVGVIRKAILAEIAFVGSDPSENEQEELMRIEPLAHLLDGLIKDYKDFSAVRDQGRLTQARAKLKALLASPNNIRIRLLIRSGIRDEVEETARANVRAHALIHRSEQLTIISVALAVVFGVVMIVLLLAAVRRPLAALREGMIAFSNDNLAHRIPVVGHDEFAELARRFNEMAADREERRTVLVRAKIELENAVSERTQALIEANENLVRLDAMRRRFLADASHELRTPLTIIRGESDVALRGADKSTEEYKSALLRVQEQARHTATLVDDLLFLARREAGEMRLQLQPVQLEDLVEHTSAEFEKIAAQSRILLQTRNDTHGVIVTADPNRLRQLLVICLDNAIRYTLPDGGITITLAASAGEATIAVVDDGIGISKEDLPNVFERFYRGAQANRQYTQGAGLGLSMAKSIAEAHGGTISIESAPNRGTTVTVRLPAVNRLRVVA